MSFILDMGGLGDKLGEVRNRTKEGEREGLRTAGEHVLGVSNLHVPHEDGDLERSGAVSQAEDGNTTAISYDTDYAVKQHEDESLHHDAGRHAKFLETALITERDAVLEIVAAAIRKKLGT